MNNLMRRGMLTVGMLLLTIVALPAWGTNEHIIFVQAAGGAITAELHGTASRCFDGPVDVLSITQRSGQFTIISLFQVHSPSCGLLPPTVSPYQISAPLGTLPDGRYDVLWTAAGGAFQFWASFRVVNGLLQYGPEPVPTLGTLQLVVLGLLLMLAGALFIARRPPGTLR